MIDINRNNLADSTSPYLRQHKDNPVHWQEWKPEVIEYAKKHNQPLFVSVGYATCHWCHVMANEAFSNIEVAAYLNKNFLCIKIDREQRPDIDSYLMSFIQAMGMQGGWPLNAFLTPDIKPFFAATYMPVESKFGMLPILSILQKVMDYYNKHGNDIPPFNFRSYTSENSSINKVISSIKTQLGNSSGNKFPAHSSMLFLLSYYADHPDDALKELITRQLDVMANRGLHDHLQGGFYRYCVDEKWTIPHFEKMLYDQAMHLWVYSTAYKIFGIDQYRIVAEKIITALEESFESNGLFYSALDADTDHQEGMTYIWTKEEIGKLLSDDEMREFEEVYELKPNFDGNIHLIKKTEKFLPEIERKLLKARKQRNQPFTDNKIITSWNALTGIALISAGRYFGRKDLFKKAEIIFKQLLEINSNGGNIYHSSCDGIHDNSSFLEDHAAMLLLATYLQEESNQYAETIIKMRERLGTFYQEGWVSNPDHDFPIVPADSFDHPSPSSVSLANMALLRAAVILNEDYNPFEYQQGFISDFHNLAAYIAEGRWNIIHLPFTQDHSKLPVNSIMVNDKNIQLCRKGSCYSFNTKEELQEYLQKLL